MNLKQTCSCCRILAVTLVFFFTNSNDVDALVIAYNNVNGSQEFQDIEASFGPGISEDGLLGILVRAKPSDACTSLKPPPYEPAGDSPGNITIATFALISRGECDFGKKVLNAQRAGYIGAIVHNVGSDALIKMSSPLSSEISIPAVFVSETTGTILDRSYLYDKGGEPYIQLYEGSFNPLEYYLVPFIIVISVCFVSLLCFMIIKCLRDRRRARRGRLSLQRLKKLPVKKYDKGDEYDVCAICLDDYEEGESLRILPCSHAYHCKCVDPWLTSSKRICPLCKRRVLSDDESSASSDDDESSDDERTPLVQSSTASSPNAARFATGFPSLNPLSSRGHARSRSMESSSSADTSSTEISEITVLPARRREVQRRHRSPDVTTDSLAHSSGYQAQNLHSAQDFEGAIGHSNPTLDLIDSAEAYIASRSRASESSIAVLSDVECAEPTEPHSFSSQDYHSFEEETIVVSSARENDYSPDSDIESDADPDDIIVIAKGSETHSQPEV